MPQFVDIRPSTTMAYEDDWFGPPWEGPPETAVLIHGIGDYSDAWRQWVPELAGHLRVVRLDLPGFGNSPAPAGYNWTLPEVVGDVCRFLDAMHIEKAHIVGTKFGGCVSLQLAADQPQRVKSLSVLATPFRGPEQVADFVAVYKMIGEVGVRGWAAKTQRTRLGPDVSEAMILWWTEQLMAKAPPASCIKATEGVSTMELYDVVARITAPTLVVTNDDSTLQNLDTMQKYMARIPNSELVVMPGKLYHVAAVKPIECAELVLKFIQKNSK